MTDIPQGKRGLLIILSGPSGGGKGTVVKKLREREPGIHYSISCTTRPMRPGDVEGETYFFISKEEFERRIYKNAFLEYENFYDTYYGTPRAPVEQIRNAGNDCLVEILPNGARQIMGKAPEAVSVYLLPPSMRTLYERLSSRGTESAEKLKIRFDKALFEMGHLPLYKYAVVNDDLTKAVDDMQRIVLAERRGQSAEELFSAHMLSHLERLKEEKL